MSLVLFDTEIFAPLLVAPDGEILKVGRGWPTIFDVSQESLHGVHLRELAIEAHQGRIEATLSNLSKGAPSAVVRLRSTFGGRVRRLRIRLQPLDGNLFCVVDDVTDRTSSIARTTTLASLVDHATDSWFVHDMEGRIIDTNPWSTESLGYSREELLGMRLAEIEMTIKPGRMDGVWNRMEVGRPMTVEGRHRRKDGSEFPIECRLGLFETEEDEVLMLAVVRDITDRKQAQRKMEELNDELLHMANRLTDEVADRTAELRTSVGQLQATLGGMADGLVSVGRDGLINLVNPAILALLGIEDPSGEPVGERLPPAIVELIAEAQTHHETRAVEISLAGARSAKAVASPIGERESDGEGTVVILRDITLEKEVDRMKTDFIATVSHELRTPLTSVLGFAKLTSQRLESKIFPHVPEQDDRAQRAVAQVRGNVGIILAEGNRLTALINDVLDISKMEAGRMEWQMAPVQPRELIERACAAASPLFADSPVKLLMDTAHGLPTVQGDHDRLLQVLLNLISNASKFTREGRVIVGARPVPEGVEFSISDTGAGIDPDMHESIFEKFRQVGDTLTNKPQGTGLGLPICKQIVAAHNGEIAVDSTPGRGSVFTFTIPIGEVGAQSGPGVRDLESLVRHIQERVPIGLNDLGSDVLVVDDDPSLRELLRQQLTERGYTVRLASHGREAMAQVRARRPDLVILDVMMPELSGFDVAAMLKADPHTAEIPILILSIVQDKERGLRLGVDRYLTKPADADVLLDTVQDLLKQVRSPRRVLVVDESTGAADDMVKLLQAKGYQVVGTCTGVDCLEQAKKTRPDLILVESMVASTDDLIRTIRFERGLEHVYVVQLMDRGADGAT